MNQYSLFNSAGEQPRVKTALDISAKRGTIANKDYYQVE